MSTWKHHDTLNVIRAVKDTVQTHDKELEKLAEGFEKMGLLLASYGQRLGALEKQAALHEKELEIAKELSTEVVAALKRLKAEIRKL